MKPDISVMIGDTKFNYRVACLLEDNGRFLLHKSKKEDFWNLVGGRIKCTEDNQTAIKRELSEELGINLDCPKLIHILENYFIYDNKNYHELLFVFYVNVSNTPITKKQDFEALDDDRFIYHWFDKTEIKNIKCLPQIIYNLPNQDKNTILTTIIR